MDFSFIDKYQEPTPPDAVTAQNDEMKDLISVAQYIPCLHWEYDPTKGGPESNGDQLGFITQSLKHVPGLASAVSVDENGVETFDSRFVAAAALSLVAALARKVLKIDLSGDYANEPREDVLGQVPTEDTTSDVTNTDTSANTTL